MNVQYISYSVYSVSESQVWYSEINSNIVTFHSLKKTKTKKSKALHDYMYTKQLRYDNQREV